MLLFRTKGRSLAALGAMLIVLLLAIDTFFQQVVEMPTMWTLFAMDSGSEALQSSTLPKVVRYSPRPSVEYRAGVEVVQNNLDIVALADAFFYDNGTQPFRLGNGTRADIPINCLTGNCTWPPYQSLGICSACEDVTTSLTFGCQTGEVDWLPEFAGSEPASRLSQTACGYYFNTTAGTSLLMSGYLVDASSDTPGEALLVRMLPLVTNPDRQVIRNGSLNFQNIRNPIVDVVIVGASGGIGSAYRNETPNAHECVLSWCVKTFNSVYARGTYAEEVTSTVSNETKGDFPWKAEEFQSPTLNGTDIYYTEDINIVVGASNVSSFNYGVSNDTMSQIVATMDDIFPSFISARDASNEPSMWNKLYVVQKGPMTRTLLFNPWMAPSNVSEHMARFATSLTNAIRSSSGSNEYVLGQAWQEEVFIVIRWQWLTFPLVLLTLSLVFLVATIVKTSGDGATGMWKTSTMPTLIYSLPKETQGQFKSSATWGSGNGAPRKTRIKLLPNMGWRVSGQSYLSRSPRLPSGERVPRGWI
jgi:hypothetical protein